MSLPISYFLPKPLFFKDTKIPIFTDSDITQVTIDEKNQTTLIKLEKKSIESGNIYELFIRYIFLN